MFAALNPVTGELPERHKTDYTKYSTLMNNIIGIRREDKYVMETRVPISPAHARKLISELGLAVHVQSSPKRVFSDSEYIQAGARVVPDLSQAPVIIGVKEIPIEVFEERKTYIFFAHVIKGQSYNMPMLRRMMELKCTLIDYEKVTDELGKRLIFFGRYAGLAGMINSLWSAGERYRELGVETPFLRIKQAHHYGSLAEAQAVVSDVGHEIAENGLPEEVTPLVIGFTGYGNVSQGAQEIAGLLPVKEIDPTGLIALKDKSNIPANIIYKVIFKEWHLSRHKDTRAGFDLQHYYADPQQYESCFEPYIPHLSMLMNCMYWDARYPRIVTKDYLEKLFSQGLPKLTVIGDITCDVDGSIECTHKGTEIEDPVFVYNPLTRKPAMGFSGDGILVMAVDILPSELPREASIFFSDVLYRYMKPVTTADYSLPFEKLDLPGPIRKAVILHQGELTPDYAYIGKYVGK